MDSSSGASRRGRSNSNKNAADAALNSSDDFENERVTRRGRPNAKLARKPQSKRKEVPSQEAARAKEEVQEPLTTSPKEPPKNFHPQPQVLRPCPMCGKNFQADQEAQRGNHLRQCGQHRGMTTEQLLQVRQLEEKQAKERAALGLPLHPVAAAPAAKQTKKASRKGAKNNAEKNVPQDPALELAMAISASLAQVNGSDSKISSIPTSNSAIVAASSQRAVPERQKKLATRARVQRTMAKTALETRTDSERERKISDKVAGVLSRGLTSQTSGTTCKQKRESQSLLNVEGAGGSGNALWQAASAKSSAFCNGVVDPYRKKEGSEKSPSTNEIGRGQGSLASSVTVSSEEVEKEIFLRLRKDWEKLFKSGNKADVTVYTKDQKVEDECEEDTTSSLRCHSVVLMARCPKLLDEVIAEDDGGAGEAKSILSLGEVTTDAAKVFLGFLYSGRLVGEELKKRSDFEGALRLARRFGFAGLEKLLRESVDESLLVPEDEEEEWDRLNEELGGGSKVQEEEVQEEEDDPSSSAESETKELEVEEAPSPSPLKKTQSLHKSLLDRMDASPFPELQTESSCRAASSKNPSPPVSDPNPSSPPQPACDSDEDLFGDDSIGGDPSPAALPTPPPVNDSPHIAEEEEEEELPSLGFGGDDAPVLGEANENGVESREDVWENFDCDAGGDIYMDDQVSQHSSQHSLEGNADNSWLRNAENNDDPPRNTDAPKSSTPRDSKIPASTASAPAAPTPTTAAAIPDFEGMLSPALRKELKRFGLKVIPRRKAVPLLQHIHRETSKKKKRRREEEEENEPEAVISSQEDQQGSSQSSQQQEDEAANGSFQLPEESILVDLDKADDSGGDDEEDAPPVTATQKERKKAKKAAAANKGRVVSDVQEIVSLLRDFILRDEALNYQVLMYEPLWLEDVFSEFKSRLGVRCKVSDFLDALDSECVTFRTRSSGDRRKKKAAAEDKRKKKSPKRKKKEGGEKSPGKKRRKKDGAGPPSQAAS